MVADANYKNLVGDFEAYSRSSGPDGKPLRPEIYEKEYSAKAKFYNFGFEYDLPGHERTIHFLFNKVAGLREDHLRVFVRTDRVAQFGVLSRHINILTYLFLGFFNKSQHVFKGNISLYGMGR